MQSNIKIKLGAEHKLEYHQLGVEQLKSKIIPPIETLH